MRNTRKWLALLLAAVLALSTTAFALADAAAGTEVPLVVGYDTFSEKFSPFVADTAYDRDVADMTQLNVLTYDRTGAVIYNAIEGETTSYNGVDYTYNGPANVSVNKDDATNTTTYVIKLREDLVFSDGVPVTADDLIFTYYVFCDPSYVGSTTINSYNIVGLKNYRTQTSDDVFNKYSQMAADIYAAGPDHEWAETDSWTKEQQDDYWDTLQVAWTNDVQGIVDYVMANYLDSYAEAKLGKTPDEVTASEGLQVALGMVMWGFGSAENGTLTATTSGKTWDLSSDVLPTIDDYYAETYAAYAGDPAAYAETESANGTDVKGDVDSAFISFWGTQDESMSGGVPNIAGITKLDDYSIQIVTNGFEAPAIYNLIGVDICPMHYYGDPEMYDYENNKFGFPYGDVSMIESKTTQPLGGGMYKFVKYENRVVYFEANELYFKGAPTTKYVQFKETATNERVPGIATAAIDAGDMNGSKTNFEEVASYNSNGETTGDVITMSTVDNLGYGYIGINAHTVCVGGVPNSTESFYLRRALATVFSVYRDVAFNSYYGEAASVINYPISNTSWAAPQPTDEDYKIAFSTDVNGNPIYTSDMSQEEKYEAAIIAAKDYLIAAGYTFDEATGKFTAAPEGAKLSYEIIIPGDGIGDHPSFSLLTDTKAALETIGIELKINDPVNSNVLWDSIDAATQELWCAAWSSTIDPDMYQTYHSSNIIGKGGSDSNHYHIEDAELDKLLLEARQSDDQSFRKAVYKQCLDLIVDWAVEIPAYQRQNCNLFSSQRIVSGTILPDITTFYSWLKGVYLVEMTK